MPPTFEPRETKNSTGPTIGIFIILLLMIIGGVYFWYEHTHQTVLPVTYIPGSTSTATTQ